MKEKGRSRKRREGSVSLQVGINLQVYSCKINKQCAYYGLTSSQHLVKIIPQSLHLFLK